MRTPWRYLQDLLRQHYEPSTANDFAALMGETLRERHAAIATYERRPIIGNAYVCTVCNVIQVDPREDNGGKCVVCQSYEVAPLHEAKPVVARPAMTMNEVHEQLRRRR